MIGTPTILQGFAASFIALERESGFYRASAAQELQLRRTTSRLRFPEILRLSHPLSKCTGV